MLTKSKTFYSVVNTRTEFIDEEGERTGMYGIEVISDDEKIFAIHDISICKKYVESLVDIFNRNELSPLHIYDVLTDML